MKKIIFTLCMFSFIFSSVEISGDARFRPRFDQKINGDETSTSDLYYLYRARINFKVDIDGGWYFKTKLGTSSIAGMSKMGSDGSGPGIESSYRPLVSFMELNFGYKAESCGYWAGIFPLKSNPSLDIHFYPNKLVDIPFALYSNGAIMGMGGYKTFFSNKVNWFMSVDKNVTNNEEYQLDNNLADSSSIDFYTLGLNSSIKLSQVTLTPTLLYSFRNKNSNSPLTVGGDITLPRISNIKSSLSYYNSYNGDEGDNDYYQVDHFRLSLIYPFNENKIKLFYDMANHNDDQFSYLWISYTHMCYKGDLGEVSMSPTIRMQTGTGIGDDHDKDYKRNKFELTTQIKFK